jgi:hypothetical protein
MVYLIVIMVLLLLQQLLLKKSLLDIDDSNNVKLVGIVSRVMRNFVEIFHLF